MKPADLRVHTRPTSVDEIVTHVPARVLDQFGLDLPAAFITDPRVPFTVTDLPASVLNVHKDPVPG